MVEAWQTPDTVIVHEAWWNANARHADIIFPMATTLERNDIGVSRTDSYFFAMQKATEPYGDTKQITKYLPVWQLGLAVNQTTRKVGMRKNGWSICLIGCGKMQLRSARKCPVWKNSGSEAVTSSLIPKGQCL